MKVKLIQHTGDPEKLIASAAKLCYSPSNIDDIMESFDEESTTRYVNMIASLGHNSVIEHVSFTFGIEGVSRSLLAQITRHRLASFSVQSQRYVKEKMFEYVVPPEIADITEAREEFIKAMDEDQKHYEKLTDLLKQKHYKAMLEAGMSEKAAENSSTKKAIEDARFVLPNACTTKIMMTINARSLQNFFSLRCCNRAQWEIRELASQMYALVYPIAPHIFSKSGPSCTFGACTEGKMCCGKQDEVRAKFEQIRNNNN